MVSRSLEAIRASVTVEDLAEAVAVGLGEQTKEAEEMMRVVDRNGDGVISFSEFRCMMGANPIIL